MNNPIPTLSNFQIVSWNCQYIHQKRDHITLFLHTQTPAILAIQEAHVSPPFSFPTHPNYNHTYIQIPNKPHGMLIYFHSSLNYVPVQNIPSSPYTSHGNSIVTWHHVSSPILRTQFILASVYIDAGLSVADFKTFTSYITATQSNYACPSIIIGDFNARHSSWDSTSNTLGNQTYQLTIDHHMSNALPLCPLQKPLTLLNRQFLLPNQQPAFTRPIAKTCIDLAFTSHPNIITDFTTSYLLPSDHLPIIITLATKAPRQQQQNFHETWSLNKADWNSYQLLLTDLLTPWINKSAALALLPPTQHNKRSINQLWLELKTIILQAANIAVGKHKVSHTSHKWYTIDPNLSALHKVYLSNKSKRQRYKSYHPNSPIPAPLQLQYASSRAAFQTAKANAKQLCWSQVCDSIEEKGKLVWAAWHKSIPSLSPPLSTFQTSVQNNNVAIPVLQANIPLSKQQSLNNLAAHFASVSVIPASQTSNIPNDILVHQYVQNIPQLTHATLLPFTVANIKQVCKSIKHTAAGPDDIIPSFMKHGPNKLFEALHILYSICYSAGILPTEWTDARMVAIYKQEGDKSLGSNYRPISISPIIMRIFEKLMLPTLKSHMAAAGIPSTSQYGFTSKRSCYDAIYSLHSAIHHHIKLSKHLPVVFIDISKAYDRVWTEGLLYKLHHNANITGPLYYFYRALITNRTFKCIHSNLSSTSQTMMNGVPQGCVSSCHLFTIYIHDIIFGLSPDTTTNLFADDIAIWTTTNDDNIKQQALAITMSILTRWAHTWKISFSPTKTNIVIFTKSNGPIPFPPLQLTTFLIQPVKTYTYLGVTFDSKLSPNPHLTNIARKAQSTSNFIARLYSKHNPPSYRTFNRLVQSVLVPQISYGLPFVALPSYTNPLITQIRKCIITPLRRPLGLPHYAHHNSLMIESRILPLHQLQTHASLCYAHRLLTLADEPLNTNYAATLFNMFLPNRVYQYQLANHPAQVLAKSMLTLPQTQPCMKSSLLAIPRTTLRHEVFKQFYHHWKTQQGHRSLHSSYPDPNPPSLELPIYLKHDPPHIIPLRSRFRFDRMTINHTLYRFKFANCPTPTCPTCPNVDENINHVILQCPAYDLPRYNCTTALAAYTNQPLSTTLALDYPSISTNANNKAIHTCISTLLDQIQKIRKC
jgi:endonuclease/exonuclease/phosphatase family metal-dependent hydrolase